MSTPWSPTRSDEAPPTLVEVLREVGAWPPDLQPDHRYTGWVDLDVDDLVHRVGARLGHPPLRVARSAVVMAVASRLWSVTVVPFVRAGLLPSPSSVCLRDDDGSVVLGVRPGPVITGAGVDDLRTTVFTFLDPVVAALPLSPRLLWGNVATSLYAVPLVHTLPEAVEVVETLLTQPPLRGELVARPGAGTPRRSTCCLFYLVPGAGLCGDCVLDSLPTTRS